MSNVIPLRTSKKPKHLTLECEIIDFPERERERPVFVWWAVCFDPRWWGWTIFAGVE